MLVALLTGGFAGAKDNALVSGGAVETQTFVEENLSAIRDVSRLYIPRLCDLRRSKRRANHVVLNRRHDACGKFLFADVRSGLLIAVLAHVCVGLYPPGFSWSTIELLLKTLQNPSFPSLGRSGRDLLGSLAICLTSWTPPH